MPGSDTEHLRNLAGKYAEYACGQPMVERREKWRLYNLQEKTCPFHIEDNGSCFSDLLPSLACEDGLCRELEARLLYSLVAYETIDDDRIILDRFLVDWCTPVSALCSELQFTRADNGHGSSLGYKTNHPIGDIDADWCKLKKRTISLDREQTERRAHLAEDIFSGLLQRLPGLRKVSVTPWCDLRILAETCRRDVIWCRKPIPLKLCGGTFDRDDLRLHLQETLDIGKDFFIEFVYRDTNLLTGSMADRVAQTCAMIRAMTGHPEGSRG